jgi:hypothetical protein
MDRRSIGAESQINIYLGEVDVEEERFLGVGHLNPVAAHAGAIAAGRRPLRGLAACLRRVAGHGDDDDAAANKIERCAAIIGYSSLVRAMDRGFLEVGGTGDAGGGIKGDRRRRRVGSGAGCTTSPRPCTTRTPVISCCWVRIRKQGRYLVKKKGSYSG